MNPRVEVPLRWLAVVPGAALFAFLSQFPIHWTLLFMQWTSRSGSEGFWGIHSLNLEMLELSVISFTNPLIFILAGKGIAPKFKAQTAALLGILAVILYSWMMWVMWSHLSIAKMSRLEWFYQIEKPILFILGAMVGLYYSLGNRSFLELINKL